MKIDLGDWTFSRIASVFLILGFITFLIASFTLQ